MKTALVTGANKGIGLEVAKRLAQPLFEYLHALRRPAHIMVARRVVGFDPKLFDQNLIVVKLPRPTV